MHPSVAVRALLSPILFSLDIVFSLGTMALVTALNVLSWINQTGEEYLSPGEVFIEGITTGAKNTWTWIWNGS